MPSLILVLSGTLFALWIIYIASSASSSRRIAKGALGRLRNIERQILSIRSRAEGQIVLAARNCLLEARTARLKAVRVDELKNHAAGLRLQALKDAGIWTLEDLQRWPASRLATIRGIGQSSASRIAGIAQNLITNYNNRPIPHPSPNDTRGSGQTLHLAICYQRKSEECLSDPHGSLPAALASFRTRQARVKSLTTFFKWLFRRPCLLEGQQEAQAMKAEVEGPNGAGQVLSYFSQALQSVHRMGPISADHLQEDLSIHPDHYCAHLTNHLGPASGDSPEPRRVSVPAELVARVRVSFQGQEIGQYLTSAPTRRVTQQSSKPYWVPGGQEIEVAGFAIHGGLLYFGQGLESVGTTQPEPALVNPKLTVDRGAANCHVSGMEYWPSFSTISSVSRASYLQWHSYGRSDPAADIGYVFLYFYGLERRVLWDAKHDLEAQADLPMIELELRRLLGIYGSNGSFRSYATSLLEFLEASREVPDEFDSELELGIANRGTLPFRVRLALGRFAKDGRPLSPEWAYAWFLLDPSTRLRTAASRCPSAFRSIFLAEFSKRYPQGLKLPVNKTMLKITHRPASRSFNGEISTLGLDLPDVSVLSAPIRKLQEIGEASYAHLEPYSRFLGRNPGQENNLEALLLLPPVFWPEVVRTPLISLKDEITSSGQPKIMRLVDLQLMLPEGAELTKGRYQALGKALESLGLGLEPDVRFDGLMPAMDGGIILFPTLPQTSEKVISAAFQGASLLLHLASYVAASDGSFDDDEASLLLEYIEGGANLPPVERQRLAARLSLFRSTPPSLSGLKGRIDLLTPPAREATADFLVQVVQVDGKVTASEVRSLERIFKLLGLPEGAIYQKLHGASQEPVTLRTASEPGTAFRIPRPPKEPAESVSGIRLDMAKVAALREDSARVSKLLGEIFTESPASNSTEPEILSRELSSQTESILGLDSDHEGLLKILLQRPQWNPDELQELCQDRGLMLDGAIERINEAAFERFDQAIIEGNGPFDINLDLLKEDAA